jgi:hypothetical protein
MRNGKSTLIETLKAVLGPLVVPVQAESLMQQKFPRSAAAPSPDVHGFPGGAAVLGKRDRRGAAAERREGEDVHRRRYIDRPVALMISG